MKKLALVAVGVTIVLIGFMTILYYLPCTQECRGDRSACEMKDGDGKCSGHHDGCEKENDKNCDKDKGGCKMEGMENGGCKMEGNENGGCKMEGNESGGCKMEGMENGGCKMDGKEKEGCDMKSGGSSCSMENGNQCCCCCKMMMMMMNGCKMKCDSMKKDSVHVKIRGKM